MPRASVALSGIVLCEECTSPGTTTPPSHPPRQSLESRRICGAPLLGRPCGAAKPCCSGTGWPCSWGGDGHHAAVAPVIGVQGKTSLGTTRTPGGLVQSGLDRGVGLSLTRQPDKTLHPNSAVRTSDLQSDQGREMLPDDTSSRQIPAEHGRTRNCERVVCSVT